MKYLHLWQNEKFTQSNIDFFNEYFISVDHLFIIVGKGLGIKIKKATNILELNNSLIDFLIIIKAMYKFEKIYIHGLFNFRLEVVLFLQPWLLGKCNWIIWGGDLYSYNKRKVTLPQKVREFVRKIVIKNLGGIITLVKGDYGLAKEWYGVKGKHYEGQYADIKKNNFLNQLVMTTRESNNKVKTRIILGNSATKSNNHIEALEMLQKFKNFNIQIICPLSYGDQEYANLVEEKGKMLFGNKFVAIRKYLNKKQYFTLLNKMDIGLFNNDRQQALGNIISLLYLMKKIYLRDDTTMYKELRDEKGFHIFNTNDIKLITYNEFISMEQDTKKENYKMAVEFYNPIAIKQKWDVIFDN